MNFGRRNLAKYLNNEIKRLILGQLSEFEIIKEFFKPLADNEISLSLADDVAKFPIDEEYELVFTKDICVAGVHFFPDDPPELISRKALRVNLSDLAAKGSQPVGYLLGLGLPNNWDRKWLGQFCNGLHQDHRIFGISLFGGDTVRSPNDLFISITAIGKIQRGLFRKRDTAKVGDYVYVTGTIGDANLGLLVQKKQLVLADESDRLYLINRYLLPEPRTNAVPLIHEFANASLDISDGLIADLNHLCEASNVGAEINIDAIPISSPANNALAAGQCKLTEIIVGGDDYELLFTVPESKVEMFETTKKTCELQFTNIGRITKNKIIQVLDSEGTQVEFDSTGFKHF